MLTDMIDNGQGIHSARVVFSLLMNMHGILIVRNHSERPFYAW